MSTNILKDDLEYISNYNLPYENLKGHTVLVTGATGLIGFQLIKALLAIRDIRIVALIRNLNKAKEIYTKEEMQHISFVIGDIVKKINIDVQIDYIFHCAAVTTSKTLINNPVETIITSVNGTNNILKLAAEKKSKSVVFISSMEMYGSFDDDAGEVTEEKIGYIDPLKVRSNYPESKRLCENMCIAYLHEYNVPVKIARLAQTFGAGILPWENRVFAQFAHSAMNETDIVLHTKGLSEGNYCYTSDCITGLLTILLKGENGEAYNISNPNNHTTIANMALMVAEKIADNKIKVIYDIPETNTFGYAADTKMKLNSEKLQKLGWKPQVNLEESYKRMIEQMKFESESAVL